MARDSGYDTGAETIKPFGQFGENEMAGDNDGDGDDAPTSNGTPAGHANAVPRSNTGWPTGRK